MAVILFWRLAQRCSLAGLHSDWSWLGADLSMRNSLDIKTRTPFSRCSGNYRNTHCSYVNGDVARMHLRKKMMQSDTVLPIKRHVEISIVRYSSDRQLSICLWNWKLKLLRSRNCAEIRYLLSLPVSQADSAEGESAEVLSKPLTKTNFLHSSLWQWLNYQKRRSRKLSTEIYRSSSKLSRKSADSDSRNCQNGWDKLLNLYMAKHSIVFQRQSCCAGRKLWNYHSELVQGRLYR